MKYRTCFFISFFVHIFLLSIFLFQLIYATRIDHTTCSYLPVYNYQMNNASFLKKDILQKKSVIHTNTTLPKAISFHSIRKPSHSQNQNDKMTTHQTLLTILHEKIASQQVYPESAIILNQTGTVHIHFILNPNGSITFPVLQQSSGIKAIDEAALKTIETLSPVHEAAIYLKNPESFSIDIIFQ